MPNIILLNYRIKTIPEGAKYPQHWQTVLDARKGTSYHSEITPDKRDIIPDVSPMLAKSSQMLAKKWIIGPVHGMLLCVLLATDPDCTLLPCLFCSLICSLLYIFNTLSPQNIPLTAWLQHCIDEDNYQKVVLDRSQITEWDMGDCGCGAFGWAILFCSCLLEAIHL